MARLQYDLSYRIVLPKEYIKALGWGKGDILFCSLQDDCIKVYKPDKRDMEE